MKLFVKRIVFGLLTLLLCFSLIPPVSAKADTARPSKNGALHVEGTQLVDKNNKPVVLKGVSTHGLTWYPEYVNESLYKDISTNWDCNFIRLAMYVDLYTHGEKEESLKLLHQGIEAAIAADMYVLVDWHVMIEENANDYFKEASEFFDSISKEYAKSPNIIYEVCNESKGEWSSIHEYGEKIIPVIRKNNPNAVIIVGTPTYDQDLMSAVRNPLDFDNIMYTCHFYTATHGEDLRNEIKDAIERKLPVFITECGVSEASGDGEVDLKSAVTWFKFCDEYKLSYAVWSLSNKAEASAMIKASSTATKALKDKDLTGVGLWVKSLIQGEDPAAIPMPKIEKNKSSWMNTLGDRRLKSVKKWIWFALFALIVIIGAAVLLIYYRGKIRSQFNTYDDLFTAKEKKHTFFYAGIRGIICRFLILLSTFFTLIYLCWRVIYSIPFANGILPIICNIILLLVEMLGFVESLVHYASITGSRSHPLPKIEDDEYPDVDIFVATYNEPVDLLRRTINGCVHMRYPDPSKVHIWICDDNRRPAMRELAEEMGVGYFDRPDNEGAKAGNLNAAMARTSAPYIVTFDADMIPKSDFLLKTVPYFVDAEKRSALLPEDKQFKLGLLQTPQCFYDPDVFQHALYSERKVPNEQDFFYRTIEPARTSLNSVIYGGSNTMLSREALNAIGGFYTGSITEDFATGVLIEAAGFVSLALPEPLASGQTPHTFKEHIQQRTRWGRGVIVTGKKLHIFRQKGLSPIQKISYWSSIIYWYSPIKNMIYLLSPLMFAVFGIPVFNCNWMELLVFWLPMFVIQDACLRTMSGNSVSIKWSGIYETCVMPHLFIPILKETFGISLTAFKVTDKSAKGGKRQRDFVSMIPFLILILLSIIGIVRVIWIMRHYWAMGLLVLLFWLIRNMYFLIMAVFLVDGRDSDTEVVKVFDAEPVVVNVEGQDYDGITTLLTEHNVKVFLDAGDVLRIGDLVKVTIDTGRYESIVRGVVTNIHTAKNGRAAVQTIELLDWQTPYNDYLQILYDRIPTLPQSLHGDFGILLHLWRNIACRVARTVPR